MGCRQAVGRVENGRSWRGISGKSQAKTGLGGTMPGGLGGHMGVQQAAALWCSYLDRFASAFAWASLRLPAPPGLDGWMWGGQYRGKLLQVRALPCI